MQLKKSEVQRSNIQGRARPDPTNEIARGICLGIVLAVMRANRHGGSSMCEAAMFRGIGLVFAKSNFISGDT